jgi:hypothetical protein
MALHLLQHDRDGALQLAHALQHAATTVRHCDRCNTFTEDVLCSFCRSGKRDPALLCIVETPADLMMVEQTQAYSGLYYVLMGRLSAARRHRPKEIRLERLITARDRRHREGGRARHQLHQRRRGHRPLHRRAPDGPRVEGQPLARAFRWAASSSTSTAARWRRRCETGARWGRDGKPGASGGAGASPRKAMDFPERAV